MRMITSEPERRNASTGPPASSRLPKARSASVSLKRDCRHSPAMPDLSIELTLREDGQFTWVVNFQGQVDSIAGDAR